MAPSSMHAIGKHQASRQQQQSFVASFSIDFTNIFVTCLYLVQCTCIYIRAAKKKRKTIKSENVEIKVKCNNKKLETFPLVHGI